MFVQAVIHFLHVFGVVLGVGGLLYSSLVLLPASRALDDAERQKLLDAVRRRGSRITHAAVVLILITGLLKWMPMTGGVGWIGYGGRSTGILHGKIGLALVVFHLALKLTRPPKSAAAAARRPRLALIAAALGVLVILLATFHRMRV